MKKIATLFIIMASMFVNGYSQIQIVKETGTKAERMEISIGDYNFTRRDAFHIGLGYERHGKIWYTCYGIYSEEADALKAHIEKNKSFYEDKFNCTIVGCEIGHNYQKVACEKQDIRLIVVYPDWEEEYQEKVLKEAEEKRKEKDAIVSKRLESINW